MSGHKFPAGLWCAARFIHGDRHAAELDVSDPVAVLATARVEIDEAISALLRGGKSDVVVSLCVGAATIRQVVPTAKEWIAATAPLRSPCCQRQYNAAFDFVGNHIGDIRRLARSLAGSGRLSAAQCLWVANEPAAKSAA